MCTSTVALADALPAQLVIAIGDSTVEKSAIGTSAPLVAVHPAGPGDGDGDGLGDGLGDGVGVGVVATVNDRVAGDGSVRPLLVARTVNVYEPSALVAYACGELHGA